MPAESFLLCLKYVLPVPNLAVISPDFQVAQKGIGRRGFLGGALALGGLTLAGIGVKAIAEYLNPPPDGLYKKIFESSQKAQTALKQYQYPGSRMVSGINVMGRYFVVVDQMLLVALAKGDEQTALSLAKSAVKYLARMG